VEKNGLWGEGRERKSTKKAISGKELCKQTKEPFEPFSARNEKERIGGAKAGEYQ